MEDIVSIVVFSSCVHSLMPIVKSKAIRNALSLLAGLAVLSVICAPLSRAVQGTRDLSKRITEYIAPVEEKISETEADSEKWVIRYGVKNIERGTQMLIASRFGFGSGDVYVEAKTGMTGNGAVTVETLTVHIMTDTPCDDTAIEQYVSDMLSCPCQVIRGGGTGSERN